MLPTSPQITDLQDSRAVIFDMDGVLIDSTNCHRAAFEQVLGTFGITDFEYPRYAGHRTLEVVQDVLRRAGKQETPDVIAGAAREKTRLALQMLEEQKPFVPGCETVLANLSARYPLGLASSGSPASVASFLRGTGTATMFSSVLSGGDVARAKPDPEIYLEAARQLGMHPSHCVVIEDAVSGVLSARAAGISRIVGIPGTSSAAELEAAGADRIVSTLAEITELFPAAAPLDPANWTAVIPAAGRGSRLGFERPKILYPVAGRPILDWLLDYLKPSCGHFIFVLSPEGHADVAQELEQRIPGRFEVVIQHTPTGMGDAVALALPHVSTRHMVLVWGDQVALRRSSVEACLRLHQGPLGADVTVPTVIRRQPYIHFQRDASGRIIEVRQAREGAEMPEEGESDTGFFCFNPVKLGAWLKSMAAAGEGRGARTGEFNLLPVIARAATEGVVLTPRVISYEETVGVNCQQDAEIAEAFLRRTDVNGN